jgi:hypothetical protein
MFAHKSVPHLSSHCALACMAKTLSFHACSVGARPFGLNDIKRPVSLLYISWRKVALPWKSFPAMAVPKKMVGLENKTRILTKKKYELKSML